MAENDLDYAVCGSTPFAGLVAGLLATAHSKRVCLIGEPWSPYRLARHFDLSVMPVTRPETWALLKSAGGETLKLLAGLGRGLYERVDPLFVAETRVSADRLGHMRWVATGLGFAAERAVDRAVTDQGTICRIRDSAMLVSGRIEPALDAWLAKAEVPRFNAAQASLGMRRDGTASLMVAGRNVEIGATILADDEAILTHLTAPERHRLLGVANVAGVLTEPAKPLGAALIHYLDRDVVVHQRAMKGPVMALSGGDLNTAPARIGASLASLGRLKRSGQSVFRTIVTVDGAPLIGRMGKGKATVVAGLGFSAAFLAPAVARHIAEAGSDEERAYFEARQVARASSRQTVAETSTPALELAS